MQLMTAAQAAGLLQDEDTVAVGGVVSMVTPEAVMRALGERYARTGAPRRLTLVCPNRTGWGGYDDEPHGLEHFAHAGMVSAVLASTFGGRVSPKFVARVVAGEIEATIAPMGLIFKWLRECTARSPGLLTQVGTGTFFDPRNAAEAGHPRKPGAFAKRVAVDGEDCIFMPSRKIDVALIRGTVADADGNISFSGEPLSGGSRQMAMAARTSGGLVIAVVKRLTERGTLHPRMVEIPGIFVDVVVLDPEAIQSQTRYEPAFTGEIRSPGPHVPMLPMGATKVILRRAAMELERGDIVNLGFGMGAQMPALAIEEGFLDDLTFSVEHGAIGGVPAGGGFDGAFGAHYNPSAIIDACDVFDFYHGGGLDATILGFAEADADGSINVGGAYGGSPRGPGGFVDITHRTRKILICGTLTSGGLEVAFDLADDAKHVRVLREGRHRKFRRTLAHIDLAAPLAVARGQRLQIITERCVFEATASGLMITEVARGVDMATDILPHLDFEPLLAPLIRPMPAAIFAAAPVEQRLRPRPPEASRGRRLAGCFDALPAEGSST